MRMGIIAVLALGLLASAKAAAQDFGALRADEMLSIEWRDCAGHFFFLGKNMSPEDSKQSKRLNLMGRMAVYAGESKSLTEALAGLKAPLGRSLADPQSGQLVFRMDYQLSRHATIAASQGKLAYLSRYGQMCGEPLEAYLERFMLATRKS